MEKTCTKCEIKKLSSEFYADKRKSDGLRSWCKECQKADNRKREKKYNETRRLYRLEHKEEARAKKKIYYENNKDVILAKNSAWRQTFKGRLLSYKRSAKKRGIEWLLSDDEFESFWGKACEYCGDEIDTIGIDRVDNNLCYEIDNCKSCCSVCNVMKSTLSENDFINKIKQIINNLKNK